MAEGKGGKILSLTKKRARRVQEKVGRGEQYVYACLIILVKLLGPVFSHVSGLMLITCLLVVATLAVN